MTQTRVACYVRSCLEMSADEISRQRQELTAYAERRDYDVVEWYEDRGPADAADDERPVLQRLLSDAAESRFAVLLIPELSQLTRATPLDALCDLGQCLDAGLTIETADGDDIDNRTIGGRIATLVTSSVLPRGKLSVIMPGETDSRVLEIQPATEARVLLQINGTIYHAIDVNAGSLKLELATDASNRRNVEVAP